MLETQTATHRGLVGGVDDNVAIGSGRDELVAHHLQTVGGVALPLQVVDEFAVGGSPQGQQPTANTGHQVAPTRGTHLQQILIPSGAL